MTKYKKSILGTSVPVMDSGQKILREITGLGGNDGFNLLNSYPIWNLAPGRESTVFLPTKQSESEENRKLNFSENFSEKKGEEKF